MNLDVPVRSKLTTRQQGRQQSSWTSSYPHASLPTCGSFLRRPSYRRQGQSIFGRLRCPRRWSLWTKRRGRERTGEIMTQRMSAVTRLWGGRDPLYAADLQETTYRTPALKVECLV